MKRLTAEEVIARAGIEAGKTYMHTDTGAVASGQEWIDTIRGLDPELDNAFDPNGDGAHLTEIEQVKNFVCTLTKSNVYGHSREVEDQKFGTAQFIIQADTHAHAAQKFEMGPAARDISETAEKQILNNTEDDWNAWSCCYIQYETESNPVRTIWYLDITEEK